MALISNFEIKNHTWIARLALTVLLMAAAAAITCVCALAAPWAITPAYADDADSGLTPIEGTDYYIDSNQTVVDANGTRLPAAGYSGAWSKSEEEEGIDDHRPNLYYVGADGMVFEYRIDGTAGVVTFSGLLSSVAKLYGYDYYVQDGKVLTGVQTLDGKLYDLDESGHVLTGLQTIDGSTYYFCPYALTGIVYIYSGYFQSGTPKYIYCFDESGKKVCNKGFLTNSSVTIAGICGPLPDKDLPTYDCTVRENATTIGPVYFGSDGSPKEGVYKVNGQIHGFTYYETANGAIICDLVRSDFSDGYYFDADGNTLTGLQLINDHLYYFDSKGKAQLGTFTINGYSYTFKKFLAEEPSSDWWYSVSGWNMYKGKMTYFRKDGSKSSTYAKVGWNKIGTSYYYFTSATKYATGWKKISGKWYCFSSNGKMCTGWKQSNGAWYYLKASGAMATNWVKVGSSWYWMGSSGVMKTGWQKISGKWYYFKADGAMVTGKYKVGSYFYWFNASGVYTGKKIVA